MEWMQITIASNEIGRELVVGMLLSMGYEQVEVIDDDAGVQKVLDETAEAWDYATAEDIILGGDVPGIRLFLPIDENLPLILAEIETRLDAMGQDTMGLDLGNLSILTQVVKEEDWENNWKIYYKPITFGQRITIVPEWEDYENTDDRAVVRLSPGAAFGTGQHESTALCLTQMDQLEFSGRRVLDMGCGTGILSVTAALLGAKEVTALDLDPLAIKSTRNNGERNGISSLLTVKEGRRLTDGNGTYDIILCNIVAHVILSLLPDVEKTLHKNGILIASGIIRESEQMVREKAEALGLRIRQRLHMGEWVMLEMVWA